MSVGQSPLLMEGVGESLTPRVSGVPAVLSLFGSDPLWQKTLTNIDCVSKNAD